VVDEDKSLENTLLVRVEGPGGHCGRDSDGSYLKNTHISLS